MEPQVSLEAEQRREVDVDDTAVADGRNRPAGEAVDDRVDARDEASAEPTGRLAAELVPAAFDHRGPMVVACLTQLLDRDVEVGLRVVLHQAVDDLDVEAERALHRLGGLVRPAQWAGQYRVDGIGRQPSRQTIGLSPAAVGQLRIRGPRPRARADAHGLCMPDEQQVHGYPASAKPSTDASSASAASGSPTLIVVIPSSRAGLRLAPRSSRNTAAAGATSSRSHTRR